MIYCKLNNKYWKKVEERLENKKLSSWKGKHSSIGGRRVLIYSILSNLPMFMLSFFEIPKGDLKKVEDYRPRFFWQNNQHKNKNRLGKWNLLCQPKEQGTSRYSKPRITK